MGGFWDGELVSDPIVVPTGSAPHTTAPGSSLRRTMPTPRSTPVPASPSCGTGKMLSWWAPAPWALRWWGSLIWPEVWWLHRRVGLEDSHLTTGVGAYVVEQATGDSDWH